MAGALTTCGGTNRLRHLGWVEIHRWALKQGPKEASVGRSAESNRKTRLPAGGVRIMAYSDKVVDHYNNPRNVGTLDKSSGDVGTGLVGAPECGDVMRLQIRVNPETQVIEEAKFKTFGCGSAIASSSLATEWIKGRKVEEALTIKNTDIVKELSLPPVKIHCSVLAEDAIRAAIGDWKKKNGVQESVAVAAEAK
jgi:nitrogen fixation NifU-like protein